MYIPAQIQLKMVKKVESEPESAVQVDQPERVLDRLGRHAEDLRVRVELKVVDRRRQVHHRPERLGVGRGEARVVVDVDDAGVRPARLKSKNGRKNVK